MKAKRIGLVALIALGLSGCGGDVVNNNIPNIYAGSWAGPWTDVLRSATGTVEWTISDTGVMTGKVLLDSSDAEGTFTGTISRDGQFSGTADFPGGTLGDFTNISGQITRSTTEVTGMFSYRLNGSNWTATVTLVPDSGAR